jgi:TonB-linked SusC/RagA family outer membrane protein
MSGFRFIQTQVLMNKLLATSIFLFVFINSLTAQDRIVSGKVTSAEDNTGLPGVNVIISGTSKGVSTDVNGDYTISLAAGENMLVFSFVGFQSQSIQVDNQTVINVSLQTDLSELEEVVVIGYGTVKKSDLTGSVSSVRGEDLVKVPSSSPMQALQGKVAGVQISSSSGAPGAGAVVRVRGVGTFGNSSPIFVVDGVITDNIDYLNSADIERMEVLKDASATAIYGSRGAHGVIMVTTRSGKKGQEAPIINFSGEYGIQRLQKKIDLLNGREFAIVVNEIKPGSYNNVDAVPNVDWQDLLFEEAPIQNYQFSATGATAKASYYFGLGYFLQDGIIPKSNFERFSVKINNTFHLSDNVRLGNNIAISPFSQQNTNGNAPFVVYRAQPVIQPYKSDGSYSEIPGVGNVLADIENTNSFNKGMRSVSNLFAEVDFFKNITFRTTIGIDAEVSKSKSFTPAFYVSPQQQNATNDLNKGYTDRVSWIWENTITYAKDIGKHRVNAVAGYTMQESTSEYLSAGAENIIRPGENFWYLNPSTVNAALTRNGVDINNNFSMISYLGRVNYTFNDRYLFTFTYRVDGSSKFSEENRYASFPAVAVGWNVINEDFLSNMDVLSNLKLRASWGIIGFEKIEYDRIYSPVNNNFGAVFGSNETVYPGSSYGISGNPDLKWESTYQTDAGIEIGLFEDKLKAEFGYYNKNARDILIPLPLTGYLGNGEGARVTFNAAEAVNSGIEYDISWTSEWKDIHYRIAAVGSTISNEAKKVFGTTDRVLLNGASTTATRPGLPIGSFYGYVVEGVFQNQQELDSYPHLSGTEVGDLRFKDVNNDGVLNSQDRTDIGSPIPKMLYGFSFEVGYKGFDLSVDFQGQSGNKIYNAKETVRPDLYNFEKHVYDRWTGEGTSSTEPRATQGGNNFLPSTRFIQDGSFFRLRNVTLGYSLPSSIAGKVRMKSAKIFVRGTNVFTKTKFNGYSPEIPTSDALNTNIDNSTYPVTSIYTAGLNVTF